MSQRTRVKVFQDKQRRLKEQQRVQREDLLVKQRKLRVDQLEQRLGGGDSRFVAGVEDIRVYENGGMQIVEMVAMAAYEKPRNQQGTKGVNLQFVYPLGTSVSVPIDKGKYELQGDLFVPVDETGLVIGSHDSSDIQIKDELVSRRHARLTYDAGRDILEVKDLGSINGTKNNGLSVSTSYSSTLRDKSQIEIGSGLVRIMYS
jgi:hypothetical protein